MSPQPFVHTLLRQVCFVTTIAFAGALGVRAQEASPPAYLGSVTGQATLERDGVAEPATLNMPFVPGDRLRTAAGRVEIVFPDGSGIEVGEYSEVEAVSATRVRLLAGTMDHIQRPVAASRSASYLPSDLQTYGSTFDQYGSWQNESPYGSVWYPSVGPDWRPYSYGSWSPIRSYGWTWIGLDAWAWPTHHYGRWGYARNSWFWIPGRTWGAAWVSWSFADDYVSWCRSGTTAVRCSRSPSDPGARGTIGPYRGGRSPRADMYAITHRREVDNRQSSVVSHQSEVVSHQCSVISRRRSVVSPQASIVRHKRSMVSRRASIVSRQ